MGQKFEWASPPAEASWDKVLIFRAASLAGAYTDISSGGASAKDSSGNWVTSYWDENGGTNNYYKVQYKNSSTGVTDSQSDPIGMSALTTLYYTSPYKVASRLQVTKFGGDTRPNIWEVVDMIRRIEDRIDKKTNHAWRTRYSASAAGSDSSSPDWEYHHMEISKFYFRTGVPVKLKHRKIRTLSAVAGDALQVWDGNQWVDYLASRTEGKSADYFVNTEDGIVYVYDRTPTQEKDVFRIKYRYGETAVPGDIEEVAILLTCVALAESDDRSYLFAQGGDSVKLDAKVTNWDKKATAILADYIEFSRGK